MADLLCELLPSLEMVRLVSSGTEATMSAIRLARGFTGRDKIVKFEGCYHGHSDSLLVKAGSGLLTFGVKSATGEGRAAGARFLDALQLFTRLVNIGDAKSLVIHPASTTHASIGAAERKKLGISDGLIRLSVGLETTEDLLEDIAAALRSA